MKILPDYLIQYIPAIEEAIEELRLSVMDHAYELLNTLDLDELTTENIRKKLELQDITLENMSAEWLPNSRFYRTYPCITHHRTRLNTLKAIGKTGGQFEGLWSKESSNGYNYYTIQVSRHYELKSELDGYFYVSGKSDRKHGNAIQSLRNDILMSQALPAGYTFLYVPWPRPTYPDDSNYFYQVHMLDHDRLTFVEDCYDLDHCNATDDDSVITYSADVPASSKYDWLEGSNTPWRTPYWFDYHYMNNLTHLDSKTDSTGNKWPVKESGLYYFTNDYGDEILVGNDGTKVPKGWDTNEFPPEKYALNENCAELTDSKSVFPTKCFLHHIYKTSPPNRLSDQGISSTINEYQVKISNIPEINSKEYVNLLKQLIELTGFAEFVIRDKLNNPLSDGSVVVKSYLNEVAAEHIKSQISDIYNPEKITFEGSVIWQSYSADEFYHYNDSNNKTIRDVEWFGPYRNDSLINSLLHIREGIRNFKQYRPFWNEKSPFLGMLQSDPTATDGVVNNSLYYWMNLKQAENRPSIPFEASVHENNYLPEIQSCIKDNQPPISEITCTSYDRPTVGRLDQINVLYTLPADEGQGENKGLPIVDLHKLYYFNETDNNAFSYNPTLYYTLISKYNDGEIEEESYLVNQYIIGDPSSKEIYLNLNGIDLSAIETLNYVMTKTPKVHTLWFNKDKTNTELHEFHNYLYRSNKQQTESGKCAFLTSITVYDAPYSNANVYPDPLPIGEYDIIDNTSSGWLRISDGPNNQQNWIYSKHTSFEFDELYHYSSNNVKLKYHIIGLYDQDGNKVECDVLNMSLYINVLSNEIEYELLLNAHNKIDDHYEKVTAAYVKYTVEEVTGSVEENTQIKLEPPFAAGLWDPHGNKILNAKYIASMDLVYGDEDNWWLPREEYINRDYSFNLTKQTISPPTTEVGNSTHTFENIDLGLIE